MYVCFCLYVCMIYVLFSVRLNLSMKFFLLFEVMYNH